jgi:hypothetical protein
MRLPTGRPVQIGQRRRRMPDQERNEVELQAEGKVVAKDDKAGKSFSTTCKNETIVVKDDKGTPVVEHKK